MEAPRSAAQRKSDTLARLISDVDAWIATADADGNGYLIPLSFLWDGAAVIVATPRDSMTARNLSRAGRMRVGIGQVRDVVMIDATAELVQDDLTKHAYAAKHGWDPRNETGGYVFFRIIPDRVQAWREVNELPGRTLMRDGHWIA
jgi:Pyridoxamine 5'-phosphate oxidase